MCQRSEATGTLYAGFLRIPQWYWQAILNDTDSPECAQEVKLQGRAYDSLCLRGKAGYWVISKVHLVSHVSLLRHSEEPFCPRDDAIGTSCPRDEAVGTFHWFT